MMRALGLILGARVFYCNEKDLCFKHILPKEGNLIINKQIIRFGVKGCGLMVKEFASAESNDMKMSPNKP
jgi:hypothetical protein